MKSSRRRTIAAPVTLAAAGATGWAARASAARYYDGPVSDHFNGTRFIDPDVTPAEGISIAALVDGLGEGNGRARCRRLPKSRQCRRAKSRLTR
jgi:hypothetical protein